MTRAVNAAARFIHISENESLSNGFQASFGLLGSGLWHGNGSGKNNGLDTGNSSDVGTREFYLLNLPVSVGLSGAEEDNYKFDSQASANQCSSQSILLSADRPMELRELSKDFKTTYRSREFKRIDAVPA